MALRQPENGINDDFASETQYNGQEYVLSERMEEIRKEVEGELDEDE